ncbi:hypothetical protein KGM_208105 [Danaus plexippus plexippus]|uniref:Uncharacterized protein n=1 Tax=Danaus plexippus plexippus TaxID=278856 RepID=A0A212FE99_DANPL|nr:hypothetical protein KGM_208105 [Danaus plexippus plexippus]
MFCDMNFVLKIVIFQSLTIPTTKGLDNDNNKLASEDVKIDVFIDRLLKSNNFDRLVETIAEKIAQRIGHCDKVKQRVELKETSQDPIKRRAHKRKDAEENTSVTENKLMLKYKLFTKNFDSDSRRSGSESRHRGLLLDFN